MQISKPSPNMQRLMISAVSRDPALTKFRAASDRHPRQSDLPCFRLFVFGPNFDFIMASLNAPRWVDQLGMPEDECATAGHSLGGGCEKCVPGYYDSPSED